MIKKYILALLICCSTQLWAKAPQIEGELVVVHGSCSYFSKKGQKGIGQITDSFLEKNKRVISLVDSQKSIEFLTDIKEKFEKQAPRTTKSCSTNIGDSYYNYYPAVAETELRYSRDGENDYVPVSNLVTVTGGYWNMCYNRALLDIIENSKEKNELNIQIPMKAIFGAGNLSEDAYKYENYVSSLVREDIFKRLVEKGMTDFQIQTELDGRVDGERFINQSGKFKINIKFFSD
ncbi:MAG: hypothetical protein CME70_11530 [Halobacteriovorax sp.]|nr:hypothetical protein [Halobacteriovorax sp.]|tara:strand:- start:51389 stop:52090 length:702 start_codon:yes stop_codon:yes gene_type:complete